jgi:hypothetical protein
VMRVFAGAAPGAHEAIHPVRHWEANGSFVHDLVKSMLVNRPRRSLSAVVMRTWP